MNADPEAQFAMGHLLKVKRSNSKRRPASKPSNTVEDLFDFNDDFENGKNSKVLKKRGSISKRKLARSVENPNILDDTKPQKSSLEYLDEQDPTVIGTRYLAFVRANLDNRKTKKHMEAFVGKAASSEIIIFFSTIIFCKQCCLSD